MVKHVCEKCNKEFIKLCDFKYHTEKRKKSCISNIKIEIKNIQEEEIPHIPTQNIIEPHIPTQNKKEYKCTTCNKIFSRNDSLKRHMDKYCNKKINNVYELYRLCSNTNVVGGASKLINHFIKTHNPSKIVSYADRRYTCIHNAFYEKIGFVKINEGTPNYWYFGKNANYKRTHRFGFAKHTLSKKLKIFNDALSEWENMKLNGYDRIWDCGSIKYEIIF